MGKHLEADNLGEVYEVFIEQSSIVIVVQRSWTLLLYQLLIVQIKKNAQVSPCNFKDVAHVQLLIKNSKMLVLIQWGGVHCYLNFKLEQLAPHLRVTMVQVVAVTAMHFLDHLTLCALNKKYYSRLLIDLIKK